MKGFNIKNIIKKRILPMAIAIATFCMVVLLIIVTRKPDSAVGATSYSIGGKTYTEDNPLVILEIVPDYTYDIFGMFVGNIENSDIDSMPTLTEKKILDNYQNLNEYRSDCMYAYEYALEQAAGNDITVCWIEKGKKNDEINKATTYTKPGDFYNLDADKIKNLEIAFKDKNGKVITYNDGEDERPIRDIFSYKVFGSGDMEGKVTVRIKKAGEVTKQDIDEAGLIYFSSFIYDGYFSKMYKTYYNADKFPSYTSGNIWVKGDNDRDMKADVAMYMYIQNISEGKAVIYSSAQEKLPKGDDTTNIGRVTLFMDAIDGDYFIQDFAYDTFGGSDTTLPNIYKGNKGTVVTTDGTVRIYLYKIEEFEYKIDDQGNKTNVIDITKRTKDAYTTDDEMIFSAYMFVYYTTYDENSGNFTSSCTKGGNSYGSNVATYPTYNGTEQAAQDTLRRFSYEVSNPNQVCQYLNNNIKEGSDYDANGNYRGCYYEDAKKSLGVDKVKVNEAIRYILGNYKEQNITTLKVLEIEPAGYFKYVTEKDSEGNDVATSETAAIIKKWFGVTSAKYDNLKIIVDHYSMNGFNALTKDLAAEYDLIIVGRYGSENMDLTRLGNVYTTGNSYAYGEAVDGATLNGNDITENMYRSLRDYALRGMPIVFDKQIYFGREECCNTDTNMYKLVRQENLVDEVIAAGGRKANISYTDTTSNDQKIPINLTYINKGDNPIRSSLSDYKAGDAGSVYSASSLAKNGKIQVVFSGALDEGTYSIKLYVDKNQDGIFADDVDTIKRELFVYDGSRGKDEKYGGKTYTGGDFSYTVELPASARGYFAWKVEVVKIGNANNSATSTLKKEELCPKSVSQGAFAIKGANSTVKVMQILSRNSTTPKFDLKENAEFNQAFSAVSNVTGLELEVTKMNENSLVTTYKGKDSDDVLLDLENYSMLVIGFEENYGRDSVLTDNIIDAIAKYIEAGHSVLFTYDTMSPMSKEYNEYKDDRTYNYKYGVRNYSKLSYMTETLLGSLRMKTQFTDPQIFRMARQDPVAGSGNGSIWKSVPYRINPIDNKIITENRYTIFNGGTNGYLDNGYLKATTSDVETNKATEINSGQVTSYPYAIKGNIPYLDGNSIDITKTQVQYFALDLEADKVKEGDEEKEIIKLYNSDGSMKDRPVVWYTLAKSYDNNYSGHNDKNMNETGYSKEANNSTARNQYLSATCRDAVNNYYMYSYGNVTFTVAGHDKIDSATERELFVNTLTKAILSGTQTPGVTYTDAVRDDSEISYPSYIQFNYKNAVQKGQAGFKFRVDYISNFYYIKDTFMYIDVADADGNFDGKYTSGKDKMLGHIDADSGSIQFTDSEHGLTPGQIYEVTDFKTLAGTVLAEDEVNRLMKDMYLGKLRIGIEATSNAVDTDKTASTSVTTYLSGFSILDLQVKSLFNLD